MCEITSQSLQQFVYYTDVFQMFQTVTNYVNLYIGIYVYGNVAYKWFVLLSKVFWC